MKIILKQSLLYIAILATLSSVNCRDRPINEELSKIERDGSAPSRRELKSKNREQKAVEAPPLEFQYGLDYDLNSEPDVLIELLMQSLSGDDLKKAIAHTVLAFPSDQWQRMLEFVAAIPPGELVEHSVGTAQTRLVNEHSELWPSAIEDFKVSFTENQMISLTHRYASKLAKEQWPEQALQRTLEDNRVDGEMRDLFLFYFASGWSKLDPVATTRSLLENLEPLSATKFLAQLGDSSDLHQIDKFITRIDPSKLSESDGNQIATNIGMIYGSNGASIPDSFFERTNTQQTANIWKGYYSELAGIDLNRALRELSVSQDLSYRDVVVEKLMPYIYEYDKDTASGWIESVADQGIKANLVEIFQSHNP